MINTMKRLFTMSKTGGGDPNTTWMGNLMVCTLTTNPTIIMNERKKNRRINNTTKKSSTSI